MRALRHREDFVLSLEGDPGFDEVLREDTTGEKELVVVLQSNEGFLQGAGNLRDSFCFLGGQLIEVLVNGLVRLDLVDDSIQTRHHLRREGEIGIAGRVRGAELDALCLRVGTRDRDTDGRGAVTGRVDEVYGRFETLHQAVVAVEAGVCEGEQGWGVLEDSPDVPASNVGESAVALLVIEQGLAITPERLVGVHT